MKKINLIAIVASMMLTACNADIEYAKNDKTVIDTVKVQDSKILQDEESKNLQKMYAEIVVLSDNTKACTNNNDWDFVPVGSKPCGGPNEYLVYSLKINTTDFLAKIRTYNAKEKEYNTKWEINSTCDFVPEPASIDCIDGKPTLIYKSQRDLEEQDLAKLRTEVVILSDNTKSCESSDNLDFVSLDLNPCGGTKEYIVFLRTINTSEFLNKIQIYKSKQNQFNTKWKINSPCEVALYPASADCVDGKPTLLYESDRTIEEESLKKLYNEIIELSLVNNQECSNAKEWAFTSIGSNPCGGPWRYIPYSLKINVTDFLSKVNQYSMKQMEYNRRWRMLGICMVTKKPSGIECNNGKATLVYNDTYEE